MRSKACCLGFLLVGVSLSSQELQGLPEANDFTVQEEQIAGFSDFVRGKKPASHPPEKKVEPALCRYDHRAQIGGNYTYAWITPEGNSTTTGSLGGVQALYEYRPLWSVYLGGAFSYRIGSTSNDVTTRELQDFNPQMRVGYTLAKEDSWCRLALFTGLGARYLAEVVTVGQNSLDFDYTEFYVPVGFLLEKEISAHFSIGCNFQWMPQIFPMVFIEPLTGARWDLVYQLANFFVEVPFKVSLCGDRYGLSINPFFETWRDGASTAETLTGLTLALPGNTYLFTGVNVNAVFSF